MYWTFCRFEAKIKIDLLPLEAKLYQQKTLS